MLNMISKAFVLVSAFLTSILKTNLCTLEIQILRQVKRLRKVLKQFCNCEMHVKHLIKTRLKRSTIHCCCKTGNKKNWKGQTSMTTYSYQFQHLFYVASFYFIVPSVLKDLLILLKLSMQKQSSGSFFKITLGSYDVTEPGVDQYIHLVFTGKHLAKR